MVPGSPGRSTGRSMMAEEAVSHARSSSSRILMGGGAGKKPWEARDG